MQAAAAAAVSVVVPCSPEAGLKQAMGCVRAPQIRPNKLLSLCTWKVWMHAVYAFTGRLLLPTYLCFSFSTLLASVCWMPGPQALLSSARVPWLLQLLLLSAGS
jgi:hypothetical protein